MITVRSDIQAGASLSDALARHPKVFSELYVAMIRAGETGGFLEDALVRVADQLESQDRLHRQVKGAMIYPVVVFTVAIGVLVGMLVFIIPVFAGVFKQFGGKLPTLTQIDHARVELLPRATGSCSSSGSRSSSSPSSSGRARRAVDRSGTGCGSRPRPRSAPVVQKVALARWSRTLSSLTTAGVPTLEAIDVTGRTAGNHVVEAAMQTRPRLGPGRRHDRVGARAGVDLPLARHQYGAGR